MFAGLDIKRFAIEVIGGLLGGFISEQVVAHPEVFGFLGEYATPVMGIVVGLAGQYIEKKGILPPEIAKILEFSGAVTTGNWIYEYIKKGFGGGSVSKGTSAEIVYVPPTQVQKQTYEAIVV